MKKVAVIMGSDSDLPIVKQAYDILKDFGIPVSIHVMSAHRSPDLVAEFSKNAASEGYGVLIAAAGMAAHLAGAVAANTTLPVIAIPVKAKALEGLDALLSSVMMPPGVPVATVAIDGAANAAYLAIQILGVSDIELSDKLIEHKKAQREKNIAANKKVMDNFI